jgi:hypothetical protein
MNNDLGPDSESAWRRFDNAWRSWSTTKRVVVYLIAFAMMTILSFGVTALLDKASAQCAFNDPDGHCLTTPQVVKKFKAGRIHHAHGFDPAAAFKDPRRFRKHAHHAIVVFLQHHPKIEGQLRAKYLTKDPGCTDYCLAWKVYGDTMAHSNCSVDQKAAIAIDPNTCTAFETGHQKAVSRGITVAYCGGALVLGALGVFSTDGAAAPAAATIYGGIGCGWGFMSSFFD